MAAADFVVHPSLEDALPTALISALASSRPIVATNVGGIPDIVGPGLRDLGRAGRSGSAECRNRRYGLCRTERLSRFRRHVQGRP